MEWLRNLVILNGQVFGIEWNTWKIIGMSGNALFFSRFIVQWWATEKRGEVVVPVAFWWLSLAGSGTLLAYALFYRQDSVFILAYAFTWIPYIRNLIIHRRTTRASSSCPKCQHLCPSKARFCPHCGQALLPIDSAPEPGQE